MSAVINKAKQQYRKSLVIETGLMLMLSLGIMVWKGNITISFVAGYLAGFLPHCVFTYWVLFRNSAKDRTKMTAFYLGEILKWLVVIVLITMSFVFISSLQYTVFFVGYILALLFNISLPILLSRKST